MLSIQDELASLTIFDPACGSGNFLTETYLSLRRLENRIIAALQGSQGELDLSDRRRDGGFPSQNRRQDGGSPSQLTGNAAVLGGDIRVKVSISQFHGMEINDFAVSVAKTALWIAEAQMLRETAEILHREPDFLPLKDYDGIVEGNALRIDWKSILEVRSTKYEGRSAGGSRFIATEGASHGDEASSLVAGAGNLFIIGNPPFVGARNKSPAQAADMEAVFGKDWKGLGNLDYVTAWYKKAAELMKNVANVKMLPIPNTNSQCAGGSRLSRPGDRRQDGGFPSQDALTGKAAPLLGHPLRGQPAAGGYLSAANGDGKLEIGNIGIGNISTLATFIFRIFQTAQAILDARSRYPDSSLADLYDPLTMPADLRAAHEANDRAVLEAYGLVCGRDGEGRACRDRNGVPPGGRDKRVPSGGRDKRVPPESEIVAHLFRLYAAMTGKAAILAAAR